MRKLKTYQVKTRAPKSTKFGDFTITEVDKRKRTAIADFGDGCLVEISIKPILDQIKKYSPTRKKFYVSVV